MLRRRARCHREVGGELPKCAEGGHRLQPDGAPLLTSAFPSPPAAAGGPFLMASEHLPDTWGDAVPPLLRPSGPPGTSHCPWEPGRQRPSQFPLDFSVGVVASIPTEAPLSIQPKRQGQIKKKKTQGDKWRGAGRGGGDDGGLHGTSVAAPLLRAGGYTDVSA